jgi:two-component system, LytTR family, response regulator
MINCIIVDDEQHSINILVRYIKQTPHLNLVATFTNPIEALSTVTSAGIDLVFLDIQMPELSGTDFIKTMHCNTRVIFITAFSEFALEGYELNVVDYLMKPVRLKRFLAAVQKVMERGATEDKILHNQKDYIFVKGESKGKLIKINLADIDFIESRRNYACIHHGIQKTIVYSSMKELNERLPKHEFLRVHKSFIVPISRITGIEGHMLRLKNINTDIMIGETYKAELMENIKRKIICFK